jgi:hypothetical protein
MRPVVGMGPAFGVLGPCRPPRRAMTPHNLGVLCAGQDRVLEAKGCLVVCWRFSSRPSVPNTPERAPAAANLPATPCRAGRRRLTSGVCSLFVSTAVA